MAKKKVSQSDLRKMMVQIKTSKDASGQPPNKKYKLSSKEQALIEEQKREDERRKSREKEKKAALAAALPNPDAVPQKSILKNKPAVPHSTESRHQSSVTFDPLSTDIEPASNEDDAVQPVVSKEDPVESSEEPVSAIPEGFFDDPVLDAKVRHVQYVDAEEAEWDKFRKEIVDEMIVAQDILVEDRNEATIDRQIEEIDDQMRAWHRVAEMEKKIEQTNKRRQELPLSKVKKEESEDDDEDYDEFLDWRTKK